MIKIDGSTYNMPVVSLKRTADFLDKYAERTTNGNLERELIGVFFNYQLQFGTTTDMTEYSRLWDKLTQPQEFHTVVVPSDTGDYEFKAYFSNVGDEMYAKKTRNYFKGLTVNFIAQSPARR